MTTKVIGSPLKFDRVRLPYIPERETAEIVIEKRPVRVTECVLIWLNWRETAEEEDRIFWRIFYNLHTYFLMPPNNAVRRPITVSRQVVDLNIRLIKNSTNKYKWSEEIKIIEWKLQNAPKETHFNSNSKAVAEVSLLILVGWFFFSTIFHRISESEFAYTEGFDHLTRWFYSWLSMPTFFFNFRVLGHRSLHYFFPNTTT